MPLLLVGLGIAGIGALIWSLSGSGSVVTRRPAVPQAGTPRAPAPVAPAAPGVAPGMVTATHDAEAIHDAAPRDRIEYRTEPARTGPTSRAIVTTTSPTETLSSEAPRPTAPRHGTSARPSATTTREAIDGAADPANVESAARAALSALTSSGSPVSRAAAVRTFQAAYGHGMTGTGRNAGAYGSRTRTAMGLVLGVPTSSLPSITVDD